LGSVLRLTDDHSSFYVGYAFSGLVEKYSVATGALVCSALAHYGDVHTLTVVQPEVLCTSGADGHVRLLDMTSNDSVAQMPTFKPTASSMSQDELAYSQISNGVMSIRLIRPQNALPHFKLVVCSSGAPLLIGLQNSLSAQSLSPVVSDNIGEKCSLRVMPGFHHSVAVLLPLPFRRSAVVKFRCSVKIT